MGDSGMTIFLDGFHWMRTGHRILWRYGQTNTHTPAPDVVEVPYALASHLRCLAHVFFLTVCTIYGAISDSQPISLYYYYLGCFHIALCFPKLDKLGERTVSHADAEFETASAGLSVVNQA